MSVVVWDGKTLAADRRQCCGEMRASGSKMRRLDDGTILAWTGQQERGLWLAQWYADGADATQWPEWQKDAEWVRLLIATSGGVKFYEALPVAQVVTDPFAAWGSGRDFAMGALGMGANARTAVEIVSRYCVSVGDGVEAYDLA